MITRRNFAAGIGGYGSAAQGPAIAGETVGSSVPQDASRAGVGCQVRSKLGGKLIASILASTIAVSVYAKGGTAKPPKTPVPPAPVVVPPPPPVPAPVFSAAVTDIKQFDVTGFIQDATVDNNGDVCPRSEVNRGGTVTVNGIKIIVPCNSIVQMPAASFTWGDLFDPTKWPGGLTLKDNAFPSFEIQVVGNIVAGKHIAGLVFASQQSAMSGQGIITRIDYATGRIIVGSQGGAEVSLEINDPNGRFGRAQSPDPRFSVDDQNPTIHAGTGYPMCVPRKDPSVSDDPECPQQNRPKAVNGCRNFTAAGVSPLPAGGELSPPAVGQVYCSHFVMEDPAIVGTAKRPNSTKQAPFEVGDYITYSGTLMHGGPGSQDFISAHTIEANVGIFTQPGTLPAYLAIGEFGVGAADPLPTAINGAAQEAQDRIFLEASVTDVKSVVDIYLIDMDPNTGRETNRWITPESMTGEANGAFGGGITTQFTGPQSQRVRIRATKAPVGLLTSPTRNLRVVVRSLCDPANVNDAVNGVPCLQRKPAANGLFTGQYLAPVFEYIFPENTVVGDPIVPNNFWSLGFLINGEGPTGVGPLVPAPW
jgi:hypothetical protein